MRQRIKQQRIQKKTILLCVEGDAEKEFFRHLKKLIDASKKPIKITIEKAGGNVVRVLKEAIKKSKDAAYSTIILVYDWDIVGKDITEEEILEKKKELVGEVKEIISDPCFEVLLLKIFREEHKKYKSSSESKSIFKKTFGVEAHEVQWEKEEKFTLEILKKERELEPFFKELPA